MISNQWPYGCHAKEVMKIEKIARQMPNMHRWLLFLEDMGIKPWCDCVSVICKNNIPCVGD